MRDQCIHVGCTLRGAVKHKMQCGHGVDVQALEQACAQKASGLIQTFLTGHRITGEQTEENFGVRVIGRDLHRLDRHHPDPRVFQLARDQLRQIALDLIGNLEGAVGGGGFSAHDSGHVH